MGRIFSPGKLMLTSEYVALDGAPVLVVPTRLGQELFFEEIQDENSQIFWTALHQEKPWLSAVINYKNWEIIETNLPEAAEFIKKVLRNVQQMSAVKFKGNSSYDFKTNLQFPADFGLGSSSTLMNNLSEWAEIDPYELNSISLGGSGYDVAAAHEKTPLIYTLVGKNSRNIERVVFSPSFKDELIFIHLGKKQDSREGIKMYRSNPRNQQLIDEISQITNDVLQTQDLEKFSYLLSLHEQKLSEFLQILTAKEKFFKNCPVFVKSLGAWGGDFVMSRKFDGYKAYFSELGFSKIFNYSELIA